MNKEAREYLDFQRRLATFKYAESWGNVAKACRAFVPPRASYYRWKKAYDAEGEAGLVRKQPRFFPERIFDLNVAGEHWGDDADYQYMGAPNTGLLAVPSDAASLMFHSGADTFEVVLVLDRMTDQIRWVRALKHEGQRQLRYISNFDEMGPDSTGLRGSAALAVASTGRFYSPATDRIFVADRMHHRLVGLNFHIHPQSPAEDYFTWESTTPLDSLFFAEDLEYIVLSANNPSLNKIAAIDDHYQKLAIFSNTGNLLNIFDLRDPADSVWHIYSSIAYNINPPNSVSIYLADRANCTLRRFNYSLPQGIRYQNEIALGQSGECELANIIYHPGLGLWALESGGPHVYHVAADLSSVIREISLEELDTRLSVHPQKIILLPNRLLVFEETVSGTGIMSFSASQTFGKRESDEHLTVPLEFALERNYPNPFNPTTTISFSIPSGDIVKLEIFNILGQRVRTLLNEHRTPRRHSVIWDGRNNAGEEVSSGVYFTRLSADDNVASQKMLLLK